MERKGICKNVGVCSKANKVQIITDDEAEFKCPECGEPLEEVKEEPIVEKKKSPLPVIIAALVALALIGGGLFFFLGGSSNEETPVEPAVADTTSVVAPEPETIVKTDTVVVRDTVVQNNTTTISEKTSTKTVVSETAAKPAAEKPSKPASASGSVNLGYAKFSGPVKNGKPNGMGTMRFTSSHIIDSRDSKGRVAEAGDYVTGEWKDGKLVQGRWFGSDGNVKGSLMIGM